MFPPGELVSQNFANNDEYIRFSLNSSRGKGGDIPEVLEWINSFMS
jgi:hypothetical protein